MFILLETKAGSFRLSYGTNKQQEKQRSHQSLRWHDNDSYGSQCINTRTDKA